MDLTASSRSFHKGTQTQQVRQMNALQHHIPLSHCFVSRARAPLSIFRGPQRAHRHGVSTRCQSADTHCTLSRRVPVTASCTALWILSALPACAEGADFSQGSFSKESYYVTLGLFLLSLPGTTLCTVWHMTGLCTDHSCTRTKVLLG